MVDSSAPARTGLAFVLLLLLGANWGIAFSFAKFGRLDGIPPLGYVLWQYGGASVVLLAICALRRKYPPLSRRHVIYYLVAGLTGIVIPTVNVLYVVGNVPVGVLTLLVTLAPLLTYGIAQLVGVDRLDRRRVCGMLLGFAGALLIFAPRTSLPSPDMAPWVALGLVTPIFYAISNVYVGVARPAGADSLALGAGMALAAVFLLLPIVLATGTFHPLTPPFSRGEIALLAHMVAAGLGMLVMFEVIRLAGVVFMSQVAYIVTLNGVFWGIYFFDEHHSGWIWAALVVILAGVALVTKPVSPRGG